MSYVIAKEPVRTFEYYDLITGKVLATLDFMECSDQSIKRELEYRKWKISETFPIYKLRLR